MKLVKITVILYLTLFGGLTKAKCQYLIQLTEKAVNPKDFKSNQNLTLTYYDKHLAYYSDTILQIRCKNFINDLSAVCNFLERKYAGQENTSRVHVVCMMKKDGDRCFQLFAENLAGRKVLVQPLPGADDDEIFCDLVAGVIALNEPQLYGTMDVIRPVVLHNSVENIVKEVLITKKLRYKGRID
ncbi:hypothetical protein [Mucilaginibacter defluvii]|uniref:Tissue inhibitor of metalloproteinase n=1 Tax=Mucilaginibacter defluvii TaxID=1196019 RepID=A0ABP9G9U0_9SPHI